MSRLVGAPDSAELFISGISPATESNTIYFADHNNGKIKKMNMEFLVYDEVQSFFIFGAIGKLY